MYGLYYPQANLIQGTPSALRCEAGHCAGRKATRAPRRRGEPWTETPSALDA